MGPGSNTNKFGGQRLLNINVGATTIEAAEKFKIKD